MRVQIISTQKLSSFHRDYFNTRFLDKDRDDEGVYLEPGSYWTFGSPVPVDQLPHDDEPNPEENRFPPAPPS